ncbi:MAG: phosphoenolpyruvate--protein phosphotransferase [Lachnospiraceae bacterium]|nr:phosphoenolpyruvate--protein phosphotransferase [Lachnospiraceae bacterium]
MKTINVKRTASKGVVMGKAYVVKRPDLSADRSMISDSMVEKEVARYEAAIEAAKADLSVLAETNAIFGAHLELVQDPTLYDGVIDKIKDEKKNAELSLEETVDMFAAIFADMDDEYMRERGSDMKDVGKRLMCKLKGVEDSALSGITEKVIVVAQDLAPSDTAVMNLEYVLGFITQEGGVTSHVSIMARNLNLPALVGVEGILEDVAMGDEIAMDAKNGTIIVNPDEAAKAEYAQKMEAFQKREKELAEISLLPAETPDGKTVELFANVGNIEDIKNALPHHIDGIGLFRTEFLYMENDHFPTEEEQFAVYKEAAELLEGKEVIIRTLDIGGDKELSYFDFGKEENPFLGYRAIRVCLDKEDVFKTQLRALLRAGAYGNVRIMYPMIISVEELDRANELLAICKEELRAEGKEFNEDIVVGMMIETPASVVLADDFASRVGFFSIGTNDLTQYTLAVDRGNKKISHMYNSFHPAVLRNIKRTIDAGHAAGIKVGMCGEFASDPKALPVLLGFGLDEFSMSAGAVSEVKAELRSTSYAEAQELADKVAKCAYVKEIDALLEA